MSQKIALSKVDVRPREDDSVTVTGARTKRPVDRKMTALSIAKPAIDAATGA